MQQVVQNDLDHLTSWSSTSRLDFNLTKCLFPPPSKSICGTVVKVSREVMNITTLSGDVHFFVVTCITFVVTFTCHKFGETFELYFLQTSPEPCITKESPLNYAKYTCTWPVT